jgi:hypothetical protein
MLLAKIFSLYGCLPRAGHYAAKHFYPLYIDTSNKDIPQVIVRNALRNTTSTQEDATQYANTTLQYLLVFCGYTILSMHNKN